MLHDENPQRVNDIIEQVSECLKEIVVESGGTIPKNLRESALKLTREFTSKAEDLLTLGNHAMAQFAYDRALEGFKLVPK